MIRDKSRIIEAIDFESDGKNWKFPFKKMTKSYGRDFIEMLKTMWGSNYDVQTEDEFCEINGIPKPFFEKTIKGKTKSRMNKMTEKMK